MRWMMPTSRCTLPARSDTTSEFDAACAISWPPCGISGRRIGTSSAAATCLTGTICVTSSSARALARRRRRSPSCLRERFRHDLDHAAGRHRGEAVHAQHRQEHVVDLVRLHRLGRDDRDLALHVRADDEVLAGDLADRRDQRLDVGVLQVQRVAAVRRDFVAGLQRRRGGGAAGRRLRERERRRARADRTAHADRRRFIGQVLVRVRTFYCFSRASCPIEVGSVLHLRLIVISVERRRAARSRARSTRCAGPRRSAGRARANRPARRSRPSRHRPAEGQCGPSATCPFRRRHERPSCVHRRRPARSARAGQVLRDSDAPIDRLLQSAAMRARSGLRRSQPHWRAPTTRVSSSCPHARLAHRPLPAGGRSRPVAGFRSRISVNVSSTPSCTRTTWSG